MLYLSCYVLAAVTQEREVNIMSTPKHKHLHYDDRCIIKEFLDHGHSFTVIANRIGKDRRTVAREVKNHRHLKYAGDKSRKECTLTSKAPYVCNSCPNKLHCRGEMYLYDAYIAQQKYENTLSKERQHIRISENEIAQINEVIAPLMIHKHHSVNHVYATHGDLLPFSESTFYRYIDKGVVRITNTDLRRKVYHRPPKAHKDTRTKTNLAIRIGRTFRDYEEHLGLNPDASVVEMDTVIGTTGGKGGKCMLTLLFRKSHLMLIYVLPYKRREYVTKVFCDIKEAIGEEEFSKLFEIILTDNGTEFSDPESIEFSPKTGERLCHLFYCDAYSSWQKGRIEKNHEYIRYFYPKGTSFSGLTQQECDLIASHINSTPRKSLNGLSPYEVSHHFITDDTMNAFHVQRIPDEEINLSHGLIESHRKNKPQI